MQVQQHAFVGVWLCFIWRQVQVLLREFGFFRFLALSLTEIVETW